MNADKTEGMVLRGVARLKCEVNVNLGVRQSEYVSEFKCLGFVLEG